MSDFVILTDSSCDLPSGIADSLGLVVAPLTFEMEGGSYTNYLDWREIDAHSFYDKLHGTALAPTSAVNVGTFTELMEPILEAGKDILYLGFSSGLSATWQNGEIAAADLREKYPERTIFTVDTLCASLGQGLLVWLTAHKKLEGKSITECRDFAEETKLHIVHWFTVEDLKFLWRGGRVSKTAATVGTILDIKPVMHVDNEGHLIPVYKVRGRKKSLRELGKNTAGVAIDLTGQTIFISHCDCLPEAEALAEQVKEAGAKDVIINFVGPVIGSHSGPGTMAIFCVGRER